MSDTGSTADAGLDSSVHTVQWHKQLAESAERSAAFHRDQIEQIEAKASPMPGDLVFRKDTYKDAVFMANPNDNVCDDRRIVLDADEVYRAVEMYESAQRLNIEAIFVLAPNGTGSRGETIGAGSAAGYVKSQTKVNLEIQADGPHNSW